MGKKQPLAAKQRSGTDITRFLERRAGQAPRKEEGSAAGVRPPGGRASTPGKHLLDNVLLSQDADDGGMQVVWASSPTAATFSPQKGAAGSQDAVSASQQQAENSQASKDGFRKTLIEALQRKPSDADRNQGGLLQQQPVDEVLEQLRARRSSHRAASTSAPGGDLLRFQPPRDEQRVLAPRPAPSLRDATAADSPAFGCADPESDDLVMREVLAGTDTYKTPAAASRRPRTVALSQGGEFGRQAMCTPSALTLGSKRPLGASGKKAASGGSNKRRALLDLLDQVELMVKHRGAGSSQQAVTQPGREGRCSTVACSSDQAPDQPAMEALGAMPADGQTAPGGAVSDAKPWVDNSTACTVGAGRLEPGHLGGGLPGGSNASRDGGPATDPVPWGLRRAVADADSILATQPVCDSRADTAVPAFGVGRAPAADHMAGASVSVSATQSLAMPPPAARPLLCTQAAAAGPATQPLGLSRVPAMPHPGLPPPAPANHMYTVGRPPAPTPHTPVIGPGGLSPAPAFGMAAAASGPPPHIVVRPSVATPAAAVADDDDDDDALWGSVDVDALVANATGQQASPTGADQSAAAAPTPAAGAAGSGPANAPVGPPPLPAPQPATVPRQSEQCTVPQPQLDRRPSEPAVLVPLLQQQQPQLQAGAPTLLKGRHEDAGRAQSGAACGGAGSSAVALLGDREEVHFVVLEVECSPHGHDKVLHCFNEYKGAPVRVCLRDMWADQEVQPGDTVNVVGGRALPSPTCTTLEVSGKEGLLVLHPDVLLSGTSVCTAIRCARQAWLQERVASGPGGERALMGSMLHELLQRSLRAAMDGKLDKNVMMDEARSILASNTHQLLESHQDEAGVLTHIAQQLDGIIAWCNTYVTPSATAPQGGRIEAPLGGGGGAAPTYCRVTEVLDIEESIWAPKYGVKGQLDATLRVQLSNAEPLRPVAGVQQQHWFSQQPQQQQQQHLQQHEAGQFHGLRNRRASEGLGPGGLAAQDAGVTGVTGVGRLPPSHGAGKPPPPPQRHQWSVGKAAPHGAAQAHTGPPGLRRGPLEPMDGSNGGLIVPFEFKTGKDWHEHRAQVLLYLLLMEDRYATAVRTGLLWNSNKPTMQAVRYAHHELAALIMHRNRLAAYLVGPAREPPPPLQGHESERKCEYCGVAATCALYLAAGAAQGGGGGGEAGASGADVAAAKAAAARLAEMDLHRALRERLATISPSAAGFFAHWVALVDMEEHAVRASRADVWALSGPQREQQGGCVAQLLLERELPPQPPPPQKQQQQREDAAVEAQRFLYVFRRKPDATAGPAVAPAAGAPLAGSADADADTDADSGGGGLLSSGFAPGDSALLGVEGRHAAAARVTVVDVTKDTLTLACRKELKYVKLGDTLPCPAGGRGSGGCGCAAGGLGGGRCGACTCNSGGDAERVTWRLDRDEAASLFAQLRLNLALLGVPGAGAGWSGGGGGGRSGGGGGRGGGGGHDAAQARREGILMQLRKLVIELEPPQQGFGQGSLSTSSQLSASAASSQLASNAYLREASGRMNGEQLEAVQRVLAMQDYAILLGMPGTGKTTTICHIIRALVETRTTILVASYTNSAVDNILLKLIGSPVSFVRLGSAQSVHPAVRPYMPGGAAHPDSSVAGLHDLMARVHVVGCTCLSVHHPLLAGRTFGVCILDEASQVTLPASLGALALARSFLLVGDHYQLSPLVVSREAAQGGLGVSLFRRLSEAHPQAVVTLRSQYRMAADIMALSNELVYNGRMLCGNDQVAGAAMHLPYLASLASYGGGAVRSAAATLTSVASPPRSGGVSPWPRHMAVPVWLLAVLRPEVRVVFLDTDGVAGCREVALQDGMVNRGEAHLVHAVASALVAAGLPPRDIGVASPYKAQVAALQHALATLASPAAATAPAAGAEGTGGPVEVLTVDKYQGRDKPAILLSFVRCNASRSAGRLLADWQRLNVAITRARTKLVLVGSAATLGSIPLLDAMLTLLRRNGWVTRLPLDCLAELPPVPEPQLPAAPSPTMTGVTASVVTSPAGAAAPRC